MGHRPPYLAASESFQASGSGEIIEGLDIVSTSGNAFECVGFDDVTLRNCRIRHAGGDGVRISGSKRFKLENVEIIRTDVPPAGPAVGAIPNVTVTGSPDFTATRIKASGGSSAFYLLSSPRAVLSFIEGHDQRGPIPRGQLVQFDKSDDAILQDFSAENDRTKAWTEDNVSVFDSANAIIRRGLLDGNNSPSGVGVMVEGSGSSNALIEDVDAINQGNGAFANADAVNGAGLQAMILRRVRARGLVNTSWQSRGAPSSANGDTTSGLHYRSTNNNGGDGTLIEGSEYFYDASENGNRPLNLRWVAVTITFATDLATDLVLNDFTPRSPIRLTFPWN